jgi:Mg-chelatase subunit ChlD
MNDPDKRRIRWQLILGAESEDVFDQKLEGDNARQGEALDFLYGREYGAGRNVRQGKATRPTHERSQNSAGASHEGNTAKAGGQNPSDKADQGTVQDEKQSRSPTKNPDVSEVGGIVFLDQDQDGLNEGDQSVLVEIEQCVSGKKRSQSSFGDGSESDCHEGGMEDSQLTVPDWINAVHELFPKQTIQRLERDALERYQIEEMVTNPDLLKRAQPSEVLLKAVLRTKHLMNQEVLTLARQLVRKVVEQLMQHLASSVRSPFLGTKKRLRSRLKIAKNFDPHTTIRRNLRHYDRQSRKLFIEAPHFFSRVRRQIDRWQLIILVDESGSMLDSVIYSAVTAAIFFGLDSLRTHLCIFDTNVVDLTDQCSDPVETLMKIQLGGGTDIGQALAYGASLIDNPRRTIVILITDFFEGAPLERLYSTARQLLESGVTLLGLAALDEQANPTYDHNVAQHLVNLGAHVGAMTPGELACWIAEKVR